MTRIRPRFRFLYLQQLFSERDGDGFGTACGTDFREDQVEVLLDAVLTDAELLRDLPVGQSARDGVQDLGLAGR